MTDSTEPQAPRPPQAAPDTSPTPPGENASGASAIAAGTLAAAAALLAGAGCSLHRGPKDPFVTIEAAIFEGGYGIQWHLAMAKEYQKVRPGVRVNLWGDPRVDEKIKPRILRRNPPDLAVCNLPIWKLIVAGKLYPLDDVLDSPAYDQPQRTLRQTLVPGILSDFQYQGKTYSLPSNLGAWVVWFDRAQFRRKGWTPPRTWSEFTALCAKVKAAGVAPIAFQGKYPYYAWAPLLAVYQRLVPFDRWYAMQDLKPGAFRDPAFVRAASLMQDLAVKYFEPGALAMSHTESQADWCNGKAAMIFCGLWLKNEMKKNIPDGFEMDCFAIPPVEGGAGDPRALYCGGAENLLVFKDAAHPAEAADFMKFLLSQRAAKEYVARLDTLSPVKDCTRGVRISSALQGAVDILNRSTRIYQERLSSLYLEFNNTAIQPGLADLVGGRCTPDDFAKRLEAGAEKVRRDAEIYKPAPRGVPPV